MDFLINTPFKLNLNVIELDEHLPSMKLLFNLDTSNMQNELKHVGEVWVETKKYDSFLASLGSKTFTKSEFNSIDNNFNLILSKEDNEFFIILNIKKVGLFETSIIQSYGNTPQK
ncbi:hypothetical protein [Acinetobacter sp. WZC-1]|uniref:hypothetical protein n=1 Tax=Acinetobacter sp. WZC-1 TaxID=3459034 RepID=UPI00403E02C8